MSARSLFLSRSLAMFAALALVSTACGESVVAIPAVCSVSLVELATPVRTLLPGASTSLSAALTTANCATTPTVSWSSNASNVATVSTAGVVTGVTPGNFIITAAVGAVTDTLNMTVAVAPVSTIELVPGSRAVIVGQTLTLAAITKDAQGATLTGRVVTWSSASPATASIGATSGVVTGVVAGTSLITATSEGKTITATVTVSLAPVSTIELVPGARAVIIGQTLTLSAITKDAQGATLTGRTVTWSSASPNTAAIGATSGIVTGVSAGTSVVTATSEGQTVTATITVSLVPVSSVAITVANATMAINASQQATAIARDAAGATLTLRIVSWTSSAPLVASISVSGMITALSPGAAVITATVEGVTGVIAIAVPTPPAPTVTAVTPGTVDAVFASVPILITGTNFQPGATSVAMSGTGINEGTLNVQSSTSISIPMLIAGGTPPTTSNVTVTTFGGTTVARQVNVVAVGTAAVQLASFLGGAGGFQSYTVDCAPGSVATGLNTRIGAWLDNIQVRCQSVTGASRTFGTYTPSFQAGGNGGTPYSGSCNAGSVLTGLSGTYTMPKLGTVTGPVAFTTSCPVGLVMIGLQGAFGAYVDSVQPRCR